MNRPRLLIISFSDISSDARVLKQVRHFADAYDVTTCGYGPSPDPRVTHVQLDDSRGFRHWSRQDLIMRRFRKIYWNLGAVVDSKTALAGLDRFDVILANDIDTVGLALELDPLHGVHADIHEYAPRQNDEVLIWRVFVAPYVRWLCRTFLPHASSMTTVGEGLANEYRRRYGLKAQVVTNATSYIDAEPRPVGSSLRLVHSGASLRNRHLETLIDAVEATTTDVTLDLYLMGNDPAYVEELKDRAATSSRVHILDPLPYAQLLAKLNEYDVGLHVIPPTNFNNHWSLPNKFFDYVQARLGLIIGPSPEMVRLMDQHGLGATTTDFSVEGLTRVLNGLTPRQVATWKAKSHAAADALSAEAQIAVWDGAIRHLVGQDKA